MSKEKIPAVVACIQKMNGDLLLLNRANEPKGWCLPGGKVEEGETDLEAVIRETLEETQIDISLYDIYDRGTSESHNGRPITVFYVEVPNSTEALISQEHKGMMWMKGATNGIEFAGKTLNFMRIGLK